MMRYQLRRHICDMAALALQGFVDAVLERRIFDGQQLNEQFGKDRLHGDMVVFNQLF